MLFLPQISLALSVFLHLQPAIAGGPRCIPETVRTSSGRIIGHASSWQPEVSEYLGIPYAKKPKRFEAAKPIKGYRHRIIKADKSCPANLATVNASDTSGAGKLLQVLSQVNETSSEDCLHLNVWTKPQAGEKKKAVMIWIHGGGFNTGSGASPVYNGARLANDQDVVVVSMNYRLNIFGFPSAPDLAAQNLGLRDQRLAVEWARDNVKAFGGDPDRMILFGESAGAASVDLYSYAYKEDPIVTGFIAQSGVASNRGVTIDTVRDAWYEASAKIGCGGASVGNKTVACMQRKTTQQILDATRPNGTVPALGSTPFTPVADGDIVFSDYEARRNRGDFIQAPVLIGNNDNEGGIFIVIANAAGSPVNVNATLAIVNQQFTCGSKAAVNGRVNAGVPAWRYRYYGEYDNQDIGVKGAWHGSELAMVFGTAELTSKEPNSPEQDRLMKSMMSAWASFAKNPSGGLTALGWPAYKDDEPTLVRLGNENAAEPNFGPNAEHDGICGNSTATRRSVRSEKRLERFLF
ncbi:alpha/beta-hydrolase [Eremomyces bilateralis CBS 781.70]|uniref:Carboxylic ester hydrolase n=1 Tax=Eremomyces bilateralis CBS 781.70 TaxID=1392243 RepID=A0A6G1GCZ7_9PEZI|nr:alpha/beta-hydrolase [Eremomyces bilateralis CBS 781.70]KAF1815958.1 alpha/beta-hydrolase [Eremomyces bilateralis CBS 781.70]